jgi:hypothetical protein
MEKLFFLFVLLLSSIGVSAQVIGIDVGQTFESDGIRYKINSIDGVAYPGDENGYGLNNTLVVSGYNRSYVGNLVLKSTVDYGKKSFKVVQIIDGTSASQGAFYLCSNKLTVNLSNCTYIGDYAFYRCTGLTSITIPTGNRYIGESAFYGCTSLAKVTIGEGVKSIKENTFYDCSGLTSITIPKGVTSIESNAFHGCSSLTSVTIPNTVKSIGEWTFSGCSGLTSITIPSSVTSIEEGIFKDCSGLTSVNIRNSVTSIGNEAFCGCSGLTSVTIPNSVTSIGNEAFCGCSGLTSVTIPNSVTSIGYNAFFGCSGLTSVTFHCNEIGNWFCKNSSIKKIIIGNEVTSIGSNAFNSCSGLTSVTIPYSVTSIGSSAFSSCSGLTSVTIPSSVKSIGSGAFSGCYFAYSSFVNRSKLTNSNNWGATLVDRETEDGLLIKDNAVVKCRPWAISVSIPDNVTSIGSSAFYGCSSLQSIVFESTTPPTFGSGVLNNTTCPIYVPNESVDAYKTAKNFSQYADRILPMTTNEIKGDLSGDGKVSITDVVLIIDVIAGLITDPVKVAAADVNNDGKPTITDCVAAIDLIAAQQPNGARAFTNNGQRSMVNGQWSTSDFISASIQDNMLNVGLDNQNSYTAFQMVVTVPEGMTLGRAIMDKMRGAGHQVMVRDLDNGQYLVAGFSIDNDVLTGNNGRLLSIATNGKATGDIVISNVEFATAEAVGYHLEGLTINGTTTGIGDVTRLNGKKTDEVYDLQGRRVSAPTKGLYIYHGKKINIK